MLTLTTFNWILLAMALMGVVVFVALYFVEAGYGYLFNPKFGFPLSNKVGWVLMEAPAFLVMAAWCRYAQNPGTGELMLAGLYLLHYYPRS
ncbi:MAG: 3-oxo-5-alpha-steroid 4-dehydrogenase, partial [Alistipes sp.]|nr:3-oxo-5-alpha-steroid 4-dehydrogenase [Alistipes sp.]